MIPLTIFILTFARLAFLAPTALHNPPLGVFDPDPEPEPQHIPNLREPPKTMRFEAAKEFLLGDSVPKVEHPDDRAIRESILQQAASEHRLTKEFMAEQLNDLKAKKIIGDEKYGELISGVDEYFREAGFLEL